MDTRSATQSGLSINPVGDLLRGWRNRRAMSQADLVFEAGISIKHLSYVETGKAVGSRYILLALAGALGLSLRDRNAPNADIPQIIASGAGKLLGEVYRIFVFASCRLAASCDERRDAAIKLRTGDQPCKLPVRID